MQPIRNWIANYIELFCGVLLALFVGLVYFNWCWILSHHEELRNLGLFITTVVGIPFLMWRTIIASKDAHTNRFNHLSKTYTDAITQIGAINTEGQPNIEVRLGAIFALEQLAKNNQDYHPHIIQILCSYLRNNAPIPDGYQTEMWVLRPCTSDIQAILDVIGRRKIGFDPKGMRLNIQQTYLPMVHLSGNFEGAIFKGAKFNNAIFKGAKLSGADFYNANLTGADFSDSTLINAKFDHADLHDTTWFDADLNRATFRSSKNLNLST